MISKFCAIKKAKPDPTAILIEIISEKLGYVLSGGDLSQLTEVSEQYLLNMERKAFVELCGERKTLERIQSLLQTGKILRN